MIINMSFMKFPNKFVPGSINIRKLNYLFDRVSKTLGLNQTMIVPRKK